MKPWKSPNSSLAQIYSPPSPGKRWDNSITVMPWGSRNRTSAAAQSHMVVGPLAAITGTRLRFAMATTERKVRSQAPSARLSWGRASISSADDGRRARGPFLLGGGQRGGDLLEYL